MSHSPPVKRQRTFSRDAAASASASEAPSSPLGLICKPPSVGSQSEEDVGILTYLREGPAFFGVLKARFSDFHVREVDQHGNVVRLTDNRALPAVQLAAESRIAAAQAQAHTTDALVQTKERLSAALGEHVTSRLLRFVAEHLPQTDSRIDRLIELAQFDDKQPAVQDDADDEKNNDDTIDDEKNTIDDEKNNDNNTDDSAASSSSSQASSSASQASLSIPVPANKDARKTVHESIRTLSDGQLLSTASADGTSIVVSAGAKGSSLRSQAKRWNRFQDQWPADLPPFLHFTLLKVNVDTQVALNRLALLTGINQKTFAVAGTKDKRGVTVQRVSAHMVNAKVLLRAQAKFEQDQRQSTLRVSDFAYERQPLRLGDLSGNYFEIVIRQIAGNDYDIAAAAWSLQTNGFVNYFGMQRFGVGSSEHGTHRVGIALLRGAWKQAFDSIMHPQPHESDDIVRARRLYLDSQDAGSALRALPRHLHLERALLQAVIKHGGSNYFTAITNALPRNVRLMYVHAFQSYVWNAMVSVRLAELPRRLVVGDLVQVRAKPTGHRLPAKSAVRDSSDTAADDDSEDQRLQGPVVELKSEADCARYAWEDLVMPLPGVDVVYPSHSVGRARYGELLASLGLNIDELARGQKDLTLAGNYRHVVVVPKMFSHEIRYYDDPAMDLLLSDLDVMQAKPRPPPAIERRFKAVTLRFALPSASYATMCIREFTKLSSVDLR